MQTGKVIGKNKAIIGGAAYGYGIVDTYDSGSDLGVGLLPHVEILGRYGVGERLDMGLKLSSSANIRLDAKYQIAGNVDSKFAMALGAGFELQGSNFNEVLVYRAHFPLYSTTQRLKMSPMTTLTRTNLGLEFRI